MKVELKNLIRTIEEYYESSYRGALNREKKQIDDFFMMILFSEMMGIPNPYEFYTLEIMLDFMPSFHKWHKSVGLNESPFENLPCFCC